jgi:hypothetical protein
VRPPPQVRPPQPAPVRPMPNDADERSTMPPLVEPFAGTTRRE